MSKTIAIIGNYNEGRNILKFLQSKYTEEIEIIEAPIINEKDTFLFYEKDHFNKNLNIIDDAVTDFKYMNLTNKEKNAIISPVRNEKK